jgi:diguanylate cyclase (GGDEF)-like protein
MENDCMETTPLDAAALTRERQKPVQPTVLVCADQQALAFGRKTLEEAGFKLTRARGWSEALSLYEDLRPSSVLVDGAFLDGSGPRLCAALRRMSGRVEVPVLALCDGKRDVKRALEAGASDVALKPLDWQVVVRRLSCLFREYKASTETTRLRKLLNDTHTVMVQTLDQVEQQSRVDVLTGLPNRLRLAQVVQRALARSQRLEGGVALLTVDLDRFSDINETLGRAAGDSLLKQLARRLSSGLRGKGDHADLRRGLRMAVRIGGDEFALMLTETVSEEFLSGFAERLLQTVATPFRVDETDVYLTASVGVATAPADLSDPGELLQHAETAMYEAQRRGGGRFHIYSAALNGAVDFKLGMDRRLRAALERDELSLHYQPVVASQSRRVLGVEALLRWQDPVHGAISPGEFVPVAEETGLMTAIGTWVLRNACRQLQSWIDAGLPAIRMAVNVSRCQLERGDLATEVERILVETGLEPALLELELSERGALRTDPVVLGQIRRLKALGVRIVVDDFGTGQSAIAYLKQFPLDTLKIDRSFVMNTVGEGSDATIVSAMVAMAHRLGLDVVAEGVETEPQLERMQEFGCEAIQGFLFSRPVPPADFVASVDFDNGEAALRSAPRKDHEVES